MTVQKKIPGKFVVWAGLIVSISPLIAAGALPQGDAAALVARVKSAGANETIEVPSGIYMLPETLEVLQNGITLKGSTGNPADVVLDGQGVVRCVKTSKSELTFSDLTFRNGGGVSDAGGGLRFATGDGLVSNCVFDTCRTEGDGGGLYADKATVVDCVFTNCHATKSGGGLYSAALDKPLRGCTFVDNQADGAEVLQGGGGLYFSEAAVRMERCTFVSNEAVYGGAYFGAVADVVDCAFTNNVADGGSGPGGGVARVRSGYSEKKFSRFSRCSFVGNVSTKKGACFYSRFGERIHVSDCTFVSNVCGAAGCVYSCDSSVGDTGSLASMSNCVFRGNYSLATDSLLIERGEVAYGCEFRDHSFPGQSGCCLKLGDNARVENCSFIGGRFGAANNYGAAILNAGANVIVHSCLFVSNSAPQGVGVAYRDTQPTSSSQIENCTFAYNVQETSSFGDFYGGTTRLSSHSILRNCLFYRNNDRLKKNVVWGMDGFSQENNIFNCWEADVQNPQLVDGINGTRVDAVTDLKLSDPANWDFRPLNGSPLCDIGSNQPWMAGALDLTLEKHNYRIMNGVVDIGAYEFKPRLGFVLLFRFR